MCRGQGAVDDGAGQQQGRSTTGPNKCGDPGTEGAAAASVTFSPLRALALATDAAGKLVDKVTLSNGGMPRTRCGVVLSAGVWGSSEILMRTFNRTSLGGLWEHAVSRRRLVPAESEVAAVA